MFHSRLIPPSPVLTLNYSCSSGVWPHKQRTRTIFEMLLPASGSHLNRSEANNSHQARQYLVRMQNTWVMLRFEKAAHTVAPLGLFLRGKKSVRAVTFSCSASSCESLNIRPFSLCFTSSCKLWKKVTEGKLRQKAANGTFTMLHSAIQRA